MERVIVPDKTFNLYKEGERTFIHLLRDEESLRLKNVLKFFDTVMLVNKDTGEEMEQTFWFVYDFEDNDRFLIFVFRWDKTDVLFHKRRRHARSFDGGSTTWEEGHFKYLSKSQNITKSQLQARSLFFYVNSQQAIFPGTYFNFTNEHGEGDNEYYLVVDVLGLKTTKGKMFKVYSLFPVNFFYL